MKKRKYNLVAPPAEPDLWINPRRNIRDIDGDRAWDNKGNISPGSGARFLELADIALGTKKPEPKRKKGIGAAASATNHKS